MERLLNQYDKECMKMAMLKHEETFREQVYELHRLYRIQKMLMKDASRNAGVDHHYRSSSNHHPACNHQAGAVSSEREYDKKDLELTLGPRSYYEKEKGEAGGFRTSDNSFSSSSTGSSHVKGGGRSTLKKWGAETPVVSNQDRLNSSPPWLFQALSLNMT